MSEIRKFISDQLSVWPFASANFRALKSVEIKEIDLGGIKCRVQHNPFRAISTTADVSPEALSSRACFLCRANRPPEQLDLPFEGRKGRRYRIQVNPYPIFPGHLVIVRTEHIAQSIWHHFPDMQDFAKAHKDYVVFYNGPASGASAPDHLHFQAAPRHLMPLEDAVDRFLDKPGEPLSSVRDANLYLCPFYAHGVFALKATTSKSLSKLFYRLLDCCPRPEGEGEPRFNLFTYCKGDEWRAFVVLRSERRPHHYFSTGEDHLALSPGAADISGVYITPFKEDFDKLDGKLLEEVLSEVTISAEEEKMILWRLRRNQPQVQVGILNAPEIRFEIISDGAGPQTVSYCDGRILYNGVLYDELYFDSVTRSTLFAQASFILYDVVIGIDFHWQQKRTLSYAGALKFIVSGESICAVNCVGMEDYLLSVISSEMKSSCDLESLKAHAIISRSWLAARMRERKIALEAAAAGDDSLLASLPHIDYDVCSDDHCQRYQGLTMALGSKVREAIDHSWGQVLRYEGELCDTRYSKCCGGRTELYSTCWEDRDYPYLQSIQDPYCDCRDDTVLSRVLNDYDLETKDFHDWTVSYDQEELSRLFASRTGLQLGSIESLEALERGASGRIKRLLVKGSGGSAIIGKELAIRRALSDSHLKSSAFEIIREDGRFILKGKGWGHGVGLCQIGAAVMASKGFSCSEILAFYYRGAVIENLEA